MGTAEGLPEGTVAFLFTDLEGSTGPQQAHPAAYREALRRHHDLLLGAVEGHGGVVFETVGDAVYAAFERPTDAVAAALDGHLALQREAWGATGPLRARMGVHLGEVEAYPVPGAARGARYFGLPLARCARLLATAHGGQTVLSEAVVALVRDALPAGAGLRDLGAHRLKDLAGPERIAQLVHGELRRDFPPLRSLDALPHNLPLQVTSFVGREREAAEVERLLATARLVTLTGTGGCGKTRLALQVAADLIEAYPDGVWCADLAPLADAALVPQTVLAALGVPEAPARPALATLTEHLRGQRALVLLDNCEHLLEACARLADAVIRACRQVTVLATSRELLGIAGEAVWRVPSLAVPDPARLPPADDLARTEAVRLFAERAALVQPGFRVTPANARAVAQICVRLDGVPLALELAAARVRVLAPEQIAARLSDRFRLLTGGSRTALRRQQTLRALIDWSHDLLPAADRVVFRRLAVFPGGATGGFPLEAAEAVCADPEDPEPPDPDDADPDDAGRPDDGGGAAGGRRAVAAVQPDEVLDRLTELVDKSLVVPETPAAETRYRLLETVRQYAEEQLLAAGEAAAVRRRHAVHYLALAERAAPALAQEDPGGGPAADLLVPAGVEAEPDGALVPAPALGAGGAEHVAWLDRLEAELDNLRTALRWWIETEAAEPGLRMAVALAAFWEARNHEGEGYAVLAELLALPVGRAPGPAGAARDDRLRAEALRTAAELANRQGDYHAVRALGDQALSLTRRQGDQRAIVHALGTVARAAEYLGDFDAAKRLFEEQLALREVAGDRPGVAYALRGLGNLARYRGDDAAAQRHYEASLAIYRALGSRRGGALLQNNLGLLAYEQRRLAAARRLHEESLAARRQIGAGWDISESLENLGRVAHAEGRLDEARRLLAESLALCREIGDQQGQGCCLTYLGHVALDAGDVPVARARLRQALAVLRAAGDRRVTADALDGLAGLAAAAGRPARALRLAGAAAALCEAIGRPAPPVQGPMFERWLRPAREGLDGAAQAAALGAGRAMPLEEAVADALEGEGGDA